MVAVGKAVNEINHLSMADPGCQGSVGHNHFTTSSRLSECPRNTKFAKLRGQRKTVVKCLTCGLTNRFLSNPNYKLWCEQPEALLENQPKTDQDKNPVHQKKLSKEKGSSVKVTDEKKQVS
ncbi:hypothetical protein XENTR_v10006209 [Xenopus tropicalis]|nr:hypothetical protein XENTR_v10006209 [Xenopus tropicalis]